MGCLLHCQFPETLAAHVLPVIRYLACSWMYQIHCNVIFIGIWNTGRWHMTFEFLKSVLKIIFWMEYLVAFISDVWWKHWNAEIHEKLEFWSLHSTTADIPVLHRTPGKFQCKTVPSLRGLRVQTSHISLSRFPANSKEKNSLCAGTVLSYCTNTSSFILDLNIYLVF